MKIKLLMIILFALSILFPISDVFAPPPPDHQHAFDYSKNVIIGKILSVEILSEPRVTKTENYYSENAGVVFYEIKVEQYLKNPLDTNVIKIPGYFSYNYNEPQNVIEPLYEIGEKVFLYIQPNSHDTVADHDLIIRSYESRSLDRMGPICKESDTFYHKGECREIPECGLHTKLTNGVCVVVPIERGILMHDAIGPLLLVLLVGIIISPVYAILKFKKSINKILFIVSISIAAFILSQVIYGEFLLVEDLGVAPSANESFFFALSILGSFFITISFFILGIVYWRKNENPNKIILLIFFIIAIVPIISLMIGILPRGAEA